MGSTGGTLGEPGGIRSPDHSARRVSIAAEIRSAASLGSYGIPICASRSGNALPRPRITRPGAISSTALTVIASSTGWRVNGLRAPMATRMSRTCEAMAEA